MTLVLEASRGRNRECHRSAGAATDGGVVRVRVLGKARFQLNTAIPYKSIAAIFMDSYFADFFPLVIGKENDLPDIFFLC